MLPPILKVLSLGGNTYKPLFRQDAGGQTATINTTSVQSDRVLVLLQATVCVVSEQYRLWSVPKTSPWPIVKELRCDCAVGQIYFAYSSLDEDSVC